MSSIINIKNSGVAGHVPTTSDLTVLGELAINYTDGLIFYKDGSNNIKSIGAVTPAGSIYSIQYNNNGSLGGVSITGLVKARGSSASPIAATPDVDYTTPSGLASAISAAAYTLPTATSSVLGGVKPDGVSILNNSGSISVTKTSIGLGSVENTALSTWSGTTNITTLGAITTGTWHGTAISDSYISSASTWNNAVPSSRTVNSKALSSNISLTLDDVTSLLAASTTNVITQVTKPTLSYISGKLSSVTYNNGTTKSLIYNSDGTLHALTITYVGQTPIVKTFNYTSGILTSIS